MSIEAVIVQTYKLISGGFLQGFKRAGTGRATGSEHWRFEGIEIAVRNRRYIVNWSVFRFLIRRVQAIGLGNVRPPCLLQVQFQVQVQVTVRVYVRVQGQVKGRFQVHFFCRHLFEDALLLSSCVRVSLHQYILDKSQ